MNFYERFKERLSVLKEPIRSSVVQNTENIFRENSCSPEEALERGIAKAESEKRNL